MEPREVEQAVPVHRRVLERVGCCRSLFAVCVSRYRGEFELYVPFIFVLVSVVLFELWGWL